MREPLEALLIQYVEIRNLGHRILYDKQTGWSENIPGIHVDPKLLDEKGLQVRLPR